MTWVETTSPATAEIDEHIDYDDYCRQVQALLKMVPSVHT
jgi:hypothetical protein